MVSIKNQLKFFSRVFILAKTWGLLNILKFIPYEIYYGLRFGFGTLFSLNNDELDVSTKEKLYATEYLPTPYYIVKKTFSLVKTKLNNSTFIDFGSGAGRVMMFASLYDPKEITGVEFSEKLCNIASKNMQDYFSESKNTGVKWNIVCIDALKYEIKSTANFFFFYDPFDEKIMQHIMLRIKNSCEDYPRDIFIVYISPRFRKIVNEMGFKELYSDVNNYGKGYAIFNINSTLLQ